jgi:hypothetical protein
MSILEDFRDIDTLAKAALKSKYVEVRQLARRKLRADYDFRVCKLPRVPAKQKGS